MDIGEILAITFVLGIPSVALATHLVFRPLVKDIVGAIRTRDPAPQEIEQRIARLEETIGGLNRDMDRLLEVERFRRELESGR